MQTKPNTKNWQIVIRRAKSSKHSRIEDSEERSTESRHAKTRVSEKVYQKLERNEGDKEVFKLPKAWKRRVGEFFFF